MWYSSLRHSEVSMLMKYSVNLIISKLFFKMVGSWSDIFLLDPDPDPHELFAPD